MRKCTLKYWNVNVHTEAFTKSAIDTALSIFSDAGTFEYLKHQLKWIAFPSDGPNHPYHYQTEILIAKSTPKTSDKGFQLKKKGEIYLGIDHSNCDVTGYRRHDRFGCQRDARLNRMRSWLEKSWGMAETKSQRLKSSAMTLSGPGIWLTSSSTPVTDANIVNFSTKNQRGFVVVKHLLLTDSAPELSLSDFRQIGMRDPGEKFDTKWIKAIWASALRAEMLRCICWSNFKGRAAKSACENFLENHKDWPDAWWMKPPIWQHSPAAQASAAAWPCQ